MKVKILPCLPALVVSFCALSPLCADVTVKYQSDVKMNSLLPAPAREKAEKTLQDRMSQWSNIAIRMRNGKAVSNIGTFTSIVDYNTQQMTLIDNEHQTFATLPVADVGDKLSAAMPQMPDAAKKATEGVKTTVDSKKTGRTDTIQGIQAEEREFVISIEIPPPAGAAESSTPGSMKMRIVMRMWNPQAGEVLRNQAVREFTGYNIYANTFLNPAGMMQKMMGNMPGFGDTFKSMLAEFSKNNTMVLRTSMETYMEVPPAARKALAIDPDAPMMQMTQEAVEVSSAPLEDSMFQVPTGYKPVPMVGLLKSIMAGMTGAGSPGK